MRKALIALAIAVMPGLVAHADEVVFKNGDRVTGTIKSTAGGKLTIDTKVAGVITVDLGDVQSFSTDTPVQLKLKDKTVMRDQIKSNQPAPLPPTSQPAEVVVGGKTVPIDQIKTLNAKRAWTGSIVANGMLARGNTHSTDFGLAADASLRRDDEVNDDRFSLSGAYNFGKQRDNNGVTTTSADNWFAQAKYDKFFSDKWYGYGVFRYDHDRIAFLNYRLAPGVGVGYQWFEQPDFNLSTEAGVSYVYEDYSSDGNQDRVALRLAYHIDKKINDDVKIFHNLEWLPAFDDPSDYNLNADAGIRANLTKTMFSELKVQYQRDSTPAPGAEKNDIRFLLGLGWAF